MASLVSTVSAYGAVFAPRIFIEIEGRAADDLLPDVVMFDFTDNERKSDELIITLNNSRHAYHDDFRFAKGSRMKVRWGYPGDFSDTRQMILTHVTPAFPEGGVPTVVLRALDIRKRLNKKSKPRNWGPVSSSYIAAQIARRYRLQVDIEDSHDARKESRMQSADISDQQFLLSLAEKLTWDCYIEGDVLHFHSKRFGRRPRFEFAYYSDRTGTLMSFESTLNLNKRPKTGVVGSDPRSGASTAESSSAGDTGAAAAGDHFVDVDTDTGALFGSPQDGQYGAAGGADGDPLYSASPESDPNVIKAHAKAKQAKIELRAVVAEVSVIGTPSLRARQMIQVVGVGQAYSGAWRVRQARHRIQPSGGIYRTSGHLVRNAISKGDRSSKIRGNDKDPDVLRQDPVPTESVILTEDGSIFSGGA